MVIKAQALLAVSNYQECLDLTSEALNLLTDLGTREKYAFALHLKLCAVRGKEFVIAI